jgi:plastocyanin
MSTASTVAAAGPAATVEAVDIGWVYNGQDTRSGQEVRVEVAPGATISLPNAGASPHNFVVESLDNVVVDMPVGQTVTYTVPADAPPGEYEFICNLPGHAPAGMVGVLVVDPNATPPGGGEAAAAAPPPAEGQAAAPAGGAPPPAGPPVTLAAVDIAWEYNGQRSTTAQPSRVEVARGTVISLPNNGASPHNFDLEQLGVLVDLPVGTTGEWTVPADLAPGEYPFICSYPGHEQAGMVGVLVVQ